VINIKYQHSTFHLIKGGGELTLIVNWETSGEAKREEKGKIEEKGRLERKHEKDDGKVCTRSHERGGGFLRGGKTVLFEPLYPRAYYHCLCGC
jgi:hypothetical protein